MTKAQKTGIQEHIQHLERDINEAGLGPASVSAIGDDMVKVELDQTTKKATKLLRWLEAINVIDMTVGQFRKTDPEVRLNIRGRYPTGVFVAVVAPFHKKKEREQVDLIYGLIKRQQPHALVRRLCEFEL